LISSSATTSLVRIGVMMSEDTDDTTSVQRVALRLILTKRHITVSHSQYTLQTTCSPALID